MTNERAEAELHDETERAIYAAAFVAAAVAVGRLGDEVTDERWGTAKECARIARNTVALYRLAKT